MFFPKNIGEFCGEKGGRGQNGGGITGDRAGDAAPAAPACLWRCRQNHRELPGDCLFSGS